MTLRLKNSSSGTHDWIHDLCFQFTEATGWPLEFLPVSKNSESTRRRLENDSDCRWFTEIHDGHRRKGFLQISVPRSEDGTDPALLSVCDLAEVIAKLLNRLSTTTRTLDSKSREVSALVDIGRHGPQQQDLMTTLQQLLRAAVQLTGFRAAGFFLLEPSTNVLNLRVTHQLDGQEIPNVQRPLAETPPDLTALMRGSMLLQRQQLESPIEWLPPDSSTGLCVAVQSASGPIGTLWAYDRRTRVPSGREVHVLESMAAQIGTLLERVVLLRESETQHRLRKELQIVSENQTGDIQATTTPHAIYEAASCCRSRYELGGDLCELIPLSDHQTVVAIGDASGDSLPAAIVMTAVRGALRAVLAGRMEDSLHTEQAMDRINRALFHVTPAHQFMTFLYGILDTSAMTFTYTNAGHPPPLHVRHDEMCLLKSHGMLLGVTEGARYKRSVVNLEPKDLLILYSDGIVEAMNRSRKMFRSDGIISAVKGVRDASAEKVLQTVWRKYESHAAGGGSADDRTLLVVKMLSASESNPG